MFGFNTSPNAQSPSWLFVLSTFRCERSSEKSRAGRGGQIGFESKLADIEVKGMARFLRNRFSGRNWTLGGGIGAGLIADAGKSVDFIAEGLGGNGMGRDGSGGGIDATLHPNASNIASRIRINHVLDRVCNFYGKELEYPRLCRRGVLCVHFKDNGCYDARRRRG